MKKYFFVVVCLLLAAVLAPLGGQPSNQSLARVMKEKLRNSQVLLEGMALQDFGKVQRAADELIQLSKTEEWMVYKTPRYEVHSNEFRRSVEVIYQKAKNKNIDGVALAYLDMTMACIRCHQYVREVRDARGPASPGPLSVAQRGGASNGE